MATAISSWDNQDHWILKIMLIKYLDREQSSQQAFVLATTKEKNKKNTHNHITSNPTRHTDNQTHNTHRAQRICRVGFTVKSNKICDKVMQAISMTPKKCQYLCYSYSYFKNLRYQATNILFYRTTMDAINCLRCSCV